jgi:hypothetical protein
MSKVHAAYDPGQASWAADQTVIIALCGEVGILGPDGGATPRGFDFVCVGDPDWRVNVTCLECLEDTEDAVGEMDAVERRSDRWRR